jgi:hypothetical protein
MAMGTATIFADKLAITATNRRAKIRQTGAGKLGEAMGGIWSGRKAFLI